jgi:hypothetical protein
MIRTHFPKKKETRYKSLAEENQTGKEFCEGGLIFIVMIGDMNNNTYILETLLAAPPETC